MACGVLFLSPEPVGGSVISSAGMIDSLVPSRGTRDASQVPKEAIQ